MRQIKTVDAVGHVLCHDITQIIKDVTKRTTFRKGHVVRAEDIPVLLSLGKDNLYIWECDESMLHEDEAAQILSEICGGENMSASEVREGKIEFFADCDGLLVVDTQKLKVINSLGEIIISTRHSHFPVKKGDKLAGTRVIPLVISKEKMERAKEAGGSAPLLSMKPYKNKKTGIVTTGNEVLYNRIEDTFTPVLIEKLSEFGSEVFENITVGDDDSRITQGILDLIAKGADMVLCSGGMSVDPDDRTPLAIKNTGAEIVSYGAPALPGAMFMLAYYQGNIPIMGLPGCVMYEKRTVFDLMLPRILADEKVSASDLASLGHGGLCLGCDVCTYPNCGFGKGI